MRHDRPTLICHLGHGKTGTSYLQSVLARNAGYLSEHGLHYPPDKMFNHAKRGLVTSGNGQLLLEGNLNVSRDVLISSEILFHKLAEKRVLEEKLLSLDVDVKLILYGRNVFELLTSVWGQSIKRGGKTHDFNQYLLITKDRHYDRVLWWLETAREHGLDISLGNYSVHRETLIEDFFTRLLGNDAESLLADLDYPENNTINRSLSLAEYEFQRAINRYLPGSNAHISNALVSELPNIKAEQPYVTRDAYERVVDWLSPVIEEINGFLIPQEHLRIESFDAVNATSIQSAEEGFQISPDQINVLVSAIAANLGKGETEQVELLNEIASRLESGSALKRRDAAALRAIADTLAASGHSQRGIGRKLGSFGSRLRHLVSKALTRQDQ